MKRIIFFNERARNDNERLQEKGEKKKEGRKERKEKKNVSFVVEYNATFGNDARASLFVPWNNKAAV